MKHAFLAALLLTAIANPLAAGYTKKVAIVIFEGVEVLDLAAPAEVFDAARFQGSNGDERPFNVYTVATTRTPVASQGFLDVTADYSIADAPQPDILVLPGGKAHNAYDDPRLMAWMKTAAERADHVLTICYGSYIAGHLGLLDGIEATTWFGSVADLGARFPKTRAIPGRRFIDNGKVITSAGVAAGIDGSLHLVARLLGRYVADRVAEYMEYPWTPQAFSTSKYVVLNPQLDARGRKLQEASIAARSGDGEGAIAIYRALTAQDRNDAEAWLHLGRAMHTEKRYTDAIAAYAEAANGKAQRVTAYYNLACAYAVSGEKEKAIDALGRAIDAGFAMKSHLQHDPDLASLRENAGFKKLLVSLR